MNYSVNELNRFIETKKRERMLPENYCIIIATPDFCNTPVDGFLAFSEVFNL